MGGTESKPNENRAHLAATTTSQSDNGLSNETTLQRQGEQRVRTMDDEFDLDTFRHDEYFMREQMLIMEQLQIEREAQKNASSAAPMTSTPTPEYLASTSDLNEKMRGLGALEEKPGREEKFKSTSNLNEKMRQYGIQKTKENAAGTVIPPVVIPPIPPPRVKPILVRNTNPPAKETLEERVQRLREKLKTLPKDEEESDLQPTGGQRKGVAPLTQKSLGEHSVLQDQLDKRGARARSKSRKREPRQGEVDDDQGSTCSDQGGARGGGYRGRGGFYRGYYNKRDGEENHRGGRGAFRGRGNFGPSLAARNRYQEFHGDSNSNDSNEDGIKNGYRGPRKHNEENEHGGYRGPRRQFNDDNGRRSYDDESNSSYRPRKNLNDEGHASGYRGSRKNYNDDSDEEVEHEYRGPRRNYKEQNDSGYRGPKRNGDESDDVQSGYRGRNHQENYDRRGRGQWRGAHGGQWRNENYGENGDQNSEENGERRGGYRGRFRARGGRGRGTFQHGSDGPDDGRPKYYNDECPTCLNNFAFENGRYMVLDCRHRFHNACALLWAQKQNNLLCPICSREIPKNV